MDFDDYQAKALRTRNSNLDPSLALAVLGLGLTGEAGEAADLIKKHVGHGHPLDQEKLEQELGDVLWYVASIASHLGIPLSRVAETNVQKLMRRYPNGFSIADSQNRTAK